MAAFWGGYRVEFKIIESEKYEQFSANLRDLQVRAVEVNLPLSTKKVFKIDISKYEYCIPKQSYELDDYTIYAYTPDVPHPVSWTQVFIKPLERVRLRRATGRWPARGF